MRSGDLAAQALLSGGAEKQHAYRRLLRKDFSADLELWSRLAGLIFLGRFLLGPFPSTMVQFAAHGSRSFRP